MNFHSISLELLELRRRYGIPVKSEPGQTFFFDLADLSSQLEHRRR